MRLEARLSYALIGLVQATGYAGGLDLISQTVIYILRYSINVNSNITTTNIQKVELISNEISTFSIFKLLH